MKNIINKLAKVADKNVNSNFTWHYASEPKMPNSMKDKIEKEK